jgi:RHS repeat-associated protein
MRKDGVLNFIIGDHLGSTSLVTDANGAVINETKYKAWRETRYSSGTEQTKYQYTGQYSYASDFGLHFYNARWYDSYLNHFTQPDSIVPDPYNPQDWNRYSYVRNNPIRYTDPTGHVCVEGGGTDNEFVTNGKCDGFSKAAPTLSQMGITLDTGWTKRDTRRIREEAVAIADTLKGACGNGCSRMTSSEIFRKVFGTRTVNLNNDGLGAGCELLNCSQGTSGWLGLSGNAQGLIIHEFGHIFDHLITGQWGYGRTVLGSTTIYDETGDYVEGIPVGGGAWTRRNDGYRCDTYPCQQHPLNVSGGETAGEDFADMFMNLVLDYSDIYSSGGFASNPAGKARHDWMQSQMAIWVPLIIQR